MGAGKRLAREASILPAMPLYEIALQVEPEFAASVPRETLTALAREVLASESAEQDLGLSIVVTDDHAIRDLNRRFRDRDEPTDVLSFGLDDGEAFPTPPDAPRQLGEVVISLPTARRQAGEAGHDVPDELRHLLVHGVLHLLGYDHEDADDARVMRDREEALLGGWEH